MAKILLVGTATLDLIFRLERYPEEDDEIRAQGLRVGRGGNAANTAVVLSQLGHCCSFLGVLSESPEAAVIDQGFNQYGVDCSCCPRLNGRPPTSSIYLSEGSRTIVHYRDLPELQAQQLEKVDLRSFDWIHFEGRNVPELKIMLEHVRGLLPTAPISLELEKPRAGIETLLDVPSLIICSKGYVEHCGETSPVEFLDHKNQGHTQADWVVAWGDRGAYGKPRRGDHCYSPSFPQPKVIDTLGAGDTFNAGVIHAMANGEGLGAALKFACELAGAKCGIEGLDLRDPLNKDSLQLKTH